MDPESISRSAGEAATVLARLIEAFARFRESAKSGIPSINILLSLCRGLEDLLTQLSKLLMTSGLALVSDEDLWQGIQESVDSCKEDGVVLSAKWTSGESGAAIPDDASFEKTHLHISRMKLHSINAQLSLQIIKCIAVAYMPSASITERRTRFSRLEHMTDLLSDYIAASHSSSRAGQERPGTPTVVLDSTTQQLYRSARLIVSNIDAVSNALIGRRASRLLNFSYFPFVNYAVARHAPSSSQDAFLESKQMDPGANDLHGWLISRQISALNVQTQRNFGLLNDENSNEDVAQDHYFKMASSLFKRGIEAYQGDRFDEAEEYLRRGLERAEPLTSRQKVLLEVVKMRYCHALCCLEESHLEEAKSSFIVVATSNTDADVYLALCCLANYYLAIVNLKLQDSQLAEECCERALAQIKQEPSMGEKCQEFYDCLRVLALIYWERGSKVDAIACSDLLPRDQQISEDSFDDELESLIAIRNSQSSPPRSISEATIELPVTPATSIFPVRSRNASDTGKEVVSSLQGGSDAEAQRSRAQYHASLLELSAAEQPSERELAAAAELVKTKGFAKKSNTSKGLTFAAKEGRLDVLIVLLSPSYLANANINTHKSGRLSTTIEDTPLMLAASRGYISCCKRLLQAGAQIDLRIKGKTALECAIAGNRLETCRLLLDCGASFACEEGQDISPLALAAEHRHFAICQLLRARGADMDDNAFECTKSQRTALMQAARRNNVDAIRWLLENGASIDGHKPSVSTPLIEAARGSAFEACSLLLRRGANANLQTASGVVACRASESWWLNKFIREWPASRNAQPVDYLAPVL